MGQNGYYKLPDGLLIQWGLKAGTTGSHTVYFNTTFTDVPHALFFAPLSKSSTNNAVVAIFVDAVYTSYFRASAIYSLGGANGGAGEAFYWFAIGRWK